MINQEDDLDKKFNNFIKAIVSVAKWSLNSLPETDKSQEISNAVALARQDINKEKFTCSKCGEPALFSGRQVPTKSKHIISIQIIGHTICTVCNHHDKYKAIRAIQAPREK